jgi:hypothetical protein
LTEVAGEVGRSGRKREVRSLVELDVRLDVLCPFSLEGGEVFWSDGVLREQLEAEVAIDRSSTVKGFGRGVGRGRPFDAVEVLVGEKRGFGLRAVEDLLSVGRVFRVLAVEAKEVDEFAGFRVGAGGVGLEKEVVSKEWKKGREGEKRERTSLRMLVKILSTVKRTYPCVAMILLSASSNVFWSISPSNSFSQIPSAR